MLRQSRTLPGDRHTAIRGFVFVMTCKECIKPPEFVSRPVALVARVGFRIMNCRGDGFRIVAFRRPRQIWKKVWRARFSTVPRMT